MCGRYVSPDDAAIERYFTIDRRSPNPLVRRFNVAPTTLVPIVRRTQDGLSELRKARWGLVPTWWKQAELPRLTFNARSEEAASKPMWRQAHRQSRCLIPAEGWYEWQETEVVDRSSGEVRKVKQPYFIHRAEEPVFAFAGLVSWWSRPDTDPLVSCALLTKAAAPALEYIHPRMPVVLRAEDLDRWLDPQLSADVVAEAVTRAQGTFASYPVSTRVNNARNESPDLIQPVDGVTD
jgi:putative SOS response-associated peptidase YedK